jgi:hypothetical protein
MGIPLLSKGVLSMLVPVVEWWRVLLLYGHAHGRLKVTSGCL